VLRFIVRRSLQAAFALFVLSVLLFAWLRSLPGGVVSALLGERGTPENAAALRAALGLDDPLFVQYLRFLQRALRGDFGISNGVFRGEPALDVFVQRFPATLELAIMAMIFAMIVAIPLGYISARRRGGALDTGSVVFSLIGVAVPVFFLAYVLKYIFAVQLGWLPPSGRQSVGIDATHITNMYILDGLMTREWDAAWDAFKHVLLPAVALSSIPFAIVFRITRAAVIDVMEEDYVRTARAKGLTPRVIRGRHIMRNALVPVVTVIGLQIGALLAGAVLTEKVFAYQGIGQALAIGFERRDYPVLQVVIMMAALIYIIVNLLVDIAYAIIDPRVRTK
jgi:peptide/nickel transport system permease protein